MASYNISSCTAADGPALSHNNMSAFWQDPNWVLSWQHTTLSQHIIEAAKRAPRNLINNRETVRHQKALDPETGKLLGYIRWILPTQHAKFPNGSPVWPEAQVPAVGAEEEAEIRKVAETSVWKSSGGSDALDVPVSAMKAELLAIKPYLILDYLAVHPAHKGKGVATALVESGMRQAEKLGLDIFILAFTAGVGVYKRLGFRIEKELIQDDSMYGGTGEYGVYFMIYDQKATSDTSSLSSFVSK